MFTFTRRELLGAVLLAGLLVGGLLLRFVLLPDRGAEIVHERPAEQQAPGGTDPGEQEMIVVHVAGAVKIPGVYTLPEGARVFEAVEAAGGALPDADLHALNLAEPLFDGRKVTVPAVGSPGPDMQPTSPPNQPGDGRININTATADELEKLPGIGPARAQAIVREREQKGSFRRVEDLERVSGIGPKTVENLREHVKVY
ncbi:MAG: ComE operon protein 1 [Syntrophomonadaceae bacterium]|nr:ComE operon protein 1 [Bacillota bacterium]